MGHRPTLWLALGLMLLALLLVCAYSSLPCIGSLRMHMGVLTVRLSHQLVSPELALATIPSNAALPDLQDWPEDIESESTWDFSEVSGVHFLPVNGNTPNREFQARVTELSIPANHEFFVILYSGGSQPRQVIYDGVNITTTLKEGLANPERVVHQEVRDTTGMGPTYALVGIVVTIAAVIGLVLAGLLVIWLLTRNGRGQKPESSPPPDGSAAS